MTEIKIPFIKTKAEKYSGSNKPANMEGLTLEVSSTFRFNEVYEKFPLTAFLKKMQLKFLDGAEKEIFNELLDEDKVSFELSFEKEKVNFWVVGEEDYQKDDTKLEIDYFLSDNDRDKDIKNANLQITFEPKFAGVVKITYAGGKQPNDDQNKDKEEIDKLQAKINELEEKLRQKPSSPTNQNDQEKIKNLKNEKLGKEVSSLQAQIKALENKVNGESDTTQKETYQKMLDNLKKELEEKGKEKNKLAGKGNNSQPSNKNDFPYLPALAIGGGGDNSSFINSYYFSGEKSATG